MNLHWARPEALLLLLPLAGLAWYAARRTGAAIPLPGASSLRGERSAAALALLPGLLRTLLLAALILAIAGPRTAGAVTEEEAVGIPIVVALDISSSMLARDLGTADRLTVAREATARFIRERPDDPVGLVAFAGEAITLVPLTMHRRVLLGALDQLAIGLLEDGTAIGEGLTVAIARLRRVEAESRVIVLMSDGENNRGQVEPLEAAAAAAALGTRVFTIGVGSDGPASAPARAPPGVETVEQPGGLDEALLREIARMTGGDYFRARDAGALEGVYEQIDRLVASPVRTHRYAEVREWHLHLLLLGAVLMLLEWGTRGSRWGAVP